MKLITSKENDLIKKIKKLKTKKYREQESLYLAEGWKFLEFEEKPEIIIFREDISSEIVDKASKFTCQKYMVNKKIFKDISTQENSQGVLLVYSIKNGSLESLTQNVVILNGVSDPGNLGTIIRVVDAAGFKDLLLTKGSVDCYNEKVVRSSMGSIFNLNIHYLEEEKLIEEIKEREYKIFVTALDKTAIEYTEIKLEEKNAFVFGNEGNGVSQKMLGAADEKVIIPIYGSSESLNVAVSSGILLYEVKRKLNFRGKI